MNPGERFNPYKLYNGSFIPEGISKFRGLSPGAKLVYGRLYWFGGENGEIFPSIGTLASETGLSDSQVRKYIQELESHGFLEVDRENHHYRKDGSGGSNRYFFLYHGAFDGETGEKRKAPPLRKTKGVPLRKTDGVTPTENRTPTPTDNYTLREPVQENHHQRDSFKESHAPRSKNPKANAEPGSENQNQNQEPFSLKVDDENPKPAMVYSGPEAELQDVYRQKTGLELTPDVERRIWETVETRGILRKQFMNELRPHVPNFWKNPAGFLTDFARKIGSKAAPEARAPGLVEAEPPKNENGRCSVCRGGGYARWDADPMRCEYCTCRMGLDMKRTVAILAKERAAKETEAA